MTNEIENLDQLLTMVLEKTSEDAKFWRYYGSQHQIDVAVHSIAKYSRTENIYRILEDESVEVTDGLARAFMAVYAIWIDLDAVVQGPLNILNEPSAEAGWREKYDHELAQFVIKNGDPVSLIEDYYGWVDTDLKRSAKDSPERTVVAVLDVFEDRWSEFTDTFNDSHYGHGATAIVVYANGNTRKIRWEGELDEAVRAVVRRRG